MRTILHSDLNNFYASVECLKNPTIKDKPVVVVGSKEDRHGVVLAKNDIAKSKGIKTGDVYWEALQKCGPTLVEVKADFLSYLNFCACRGSYKLSETRQNKTPDGRCPRDRRACIQVVQRYLSVVRIRTRNRFIRKRFLFRASTDRYVRKFRKRRQTTFFRRSNRKVRTRCYSADGSVQRYENPLA